MPANEIHLFRAVKGRNYHYSDAPVKSDREQGSVAAICGATFERWYRFEALGRGPTCPGCARVLKTREAAARAV